MTQHHRKQKSVRLTIDLPADLYASLKMLAAKAGISLKQFIIQHLPSPENNQSKHRDIEKDEFDPLLRELLAEKGDLLKRLAKK